MGAKRRREAEGSGASAAALTGPAAGGVGAASDVSLEKSSERKRLTAAERVRLLKVLPTAPEKTLRTALASLLTDDRNVVILSKLVPARPVDVQHCVLCHEDFDPLLNGPVACVLVHEAEEDKGGHLDNGCFCATQGCEPDYCAFCSLRSCGFGDEDWEGRREKCYRGPHLSEADAGRCLPGEFRLDTLAERCEACSGGPEEEQELDEEGESGDSDEGDEADESDE